MPRTLLILVLLVLLMLVRPVIAGPPEAPGRDFGKARIGIRVPSTWVVVQGQKGVIPVEEGSVTFKDNNTVKIDWTLVGGRGAWSVTWFRDYELDPGSGLPVIPERLMGGNFPFGRPSP